MSAPQALDADPLQVQAERFLHAIRENDASRAVELLATHPGIVKYSVHVAAAACDADVLQQFLASDPTLATTAGVPDKREPMIYVAQTMLPILNEALRDSNTRCAELLLKNGGNATSFVLWNEDEKESKLFALYFACAANNAGTANLLLEHGADPNDGECIPHAAERNHRECLELLLKHGANISDRHPDWDNTALYFLSGYKEFNPLCASSELGMRWLLEHGANPNVASYVDRKHENLASRAEAPLHRITSYGRSVNVARMLIEYGTQVDIPRGDGKTAYALAIRAGNLKVAEYLKSVGADDTKLSPADELLGACAVADEARARKIVSMHPTLMSALTAEDRQALALAAEEGKEDNVRLMVSLGWSLSDEGAWSGTPLHHAAWHGRPAMTRLLVDLGAPINFRDSTFGSSPIAWAAHGSTNCRAGHDDDYRAVVDVLLDAGASREASYNKWNEAPESMASEPVASLLKQRGFAAQ